jgi:Xaa-Pro aminopeptidase
MSRVERLSALVDVPFLVTKSVNLTYLTGFASSNAALLVSPNAAPRLFTDFRYAEAARAVEGVEFTQTIRDVLGALPELLGGQTIAFEAEHMSFAAAERLRRGGIELVPSSGLVERLRAVKEPEEIAAIRDACALSDALYERLVEERFIGRTERDVAWWIERGFRELGADGIAFAPIVASGEAGARPHAVPRDVEIAAGTLVTVDMGCLLAGYNSDCTRTFATGPLPTELADAYELCARAQLDGLAAVRAGSYGRDVDAASRAQIEAAGLGWAYGHGLGHGIGREVHEAPVLRPESGDLLAEGNAVTVEPGLYLPGVGGVRVEDLVVVGEDGCERLTHFTKELITVS